MAATARARHGHGAVTARHGTARPRPDRAADAARADHHYVTAIDVLEGLGWLASSHVDAWRQGRLPALEAGMAVNPRKLSRALLEFRRWAQVQGLQPSETAYVSRTRARHPLRFSAGGDVGPLCLACADSTTWCACRAAT